MTGIYKIQSILYPKKYYIGSSINIGRRWSEHKKYLKSNKHVNPKLQNHYNKYGNDFIFFMVEECLIENLISREQYYIDSLNPWFNCSPTAGSQLGMKRSEETKMKMRKKRKPFSDEWKLNLSRSKLGIKRGPNKNKSKAYKPHSEEHCKNLSKSMMGKIPWNRGKFGIQIGWNKGCKCSEETKKKMSKSKMGNTSKKKILTNELINEIILLKTTNTNKELRNIFNLSRSSIDRALSFRYHK